MEQKERINDPEVAMQAALNGDRAKLWTAFPGNIQSFDGNAITCVVQPGIMAYMRAPDGAMQWIKLPLLVDVPVVAMRGGGCTLTFPIAEGDECLMVIASRCIDAWWQQGGVQIQAELRMHDLSDGFAIPGPFSQATKIGGWSMSAVQLRSNDGQAVIELNPTTHDVNINVAGNTSITAKNAAVTASESVTVTAPAISLAAAGQSLLSFVTSAFMALFNSHTHTSASAGNPTSAPNQQMGNSHITTTVKGG